MCCIVSLEDSTSTIMPVSRVYTTHILEHIIDYNVYYIINVWVLFSLTATSLSQKNFKFNV